MTAALVFSTTLHRPCCVNVSQSDEDVLLRLCAVVLQHRAASRCDTLVWRTVNKNMKALPRWRVRQPWRNDPKLTPHWTTTVQEDAERPAPLAPPCRGRGWFRELICATGLHNTSYNNSCSGMKRCWWLFSSHCFLGQVESHACSQTQFHQCAARPLQTVDMLKHLISALLILDAMFPPAVGIPMLLRTKYLALVSFLHWYPVLTQT